MGFNRNIIQTTSPVFGTPIGGPLAAWYANYLGVTNSENGSLTFEILGCPGPPPGVYAEHQRKEILKNVPGAKN